MSLSQTEAARAARAEVGRHAVAKRWAGTTPEERREQTAAARRAAAVRHVVEGWPELTEDQQQRLRALLRPVPEGGEG